MVGQGPPSLLAAQLVTMTQICQQMRDVAKGAAMQNAPIAKTDDMFAEQSNTLPRSEMHEQIRLANVAGLETWVQETVSQTSDLFAERRRVAANVKAALSVPPPKQLNLQNSGVATAGALAGNGSSS
ncbi:hypothetical protein LPJ53_001449 [Coemansia erecta]|uniref:Uncharacterized protein n=1 Tax=Coemansia erecta TaxID=147472 RepID=A0A9W7Y4B3_9FUNG|nr:hypothetical protein LPJ53_001449 [Coemansia erecta]